MLKPQNIHTYDQYVCLLFCLVTTHFPSLGHGYGFAQWQVHQVEHTNSPVRTLEQYWRKYPSKTSSIVQSTFLATSNPFIVTQGSFFSLLTHHLKKNQFISNLERESSNNPMILRVTSTIFHPHSKSIELIILDIIESFNDGERGALDFSSWRY
jgi:hypothetical protein